MKGTFLIVIFVQAILAWYIKDHETKFYNMVHFFSSLKSGYNSDVTMTSVMLPAGSRAGKLDSSYGARHQRHLYFRQKRKFAICTFSINVFGVL